MRTTYCISRTGTGRKGKGKGRQREEKKGGEDQDAERAFHLARLVGPHTRKKKGNGGGGGRKEKEKMSANTRLHPISASNREKRRRIERTKKGEKRAPATLPQYSQRGVEKRGGKKGGEKGGDS